MRRSATPPIQPPAWEPAKLALQEVGGWIKNADTKTTILAAAFGVSLTFACTKLLELGPDWISAASGCARTWALIMLIAAIAATVGTGCNIYRALVPRMHQTGSNPFAWPDLAGGLKLPPADDIGVSIEHVWSQTRVLALIAKRKYRHLKWALRWFALYLVVLVVLVGILLIPIPAPAVP